MKTSPPRTAGKKSAMRPMAVTGNFKDYVLGQFDEFGDVAARAMFGGIGLYKGDLFFGIVAGAYLYLKVDEQNREAFEKAGMPAVQAVRGSAGVDAVLPRPGGSARERLGAGAVGEGVGGGRRTRGQPPRRGCAEGRARAAEVKHEIRSWEQEIRSQEFLGFSPDLLISCLFS